jgi:hypothetical protein
LTGTNRLAPFRLLENEKELQRRLEDRTLAENRITQLQHQLTTAQDNLTKAQDEVIN